MINIEGLKLNSVDYILIVDKEFTVVYNTRFDKRVNSNFNYIESKGYLNRNLFEIYPSLKKDANSSSIVRCISTGETVVKKYQKHEDFNGNSYCTHNITIPLIRGGKILGAVEIAKDVKTIENINNDSDKIKYSDENEDFFDNIINDANEFTFETIITNDNRMLKAIEQAKKISETKNPTLVYGETGTGKEVFVQAMINYSDITRNKVIIQNCAALPQNLIESILFGTCRGAYTGAENRRGLFDEADGGIIFLDELNSIPYDVQGKLLRVLQDGSFRPVGSNVQKTVDVKIIAAMNEDPLEAIKNQHLRKDLFYRLSGGMIFLPPLRERKKDILLFTDYYIKKYNEIYSKEITGITKVLENFFQNYSWEGNVRELKHIIESMVSLSNCKILDIYHLPAYMNDRIFSNKAANSNSNEMERIISNFEDYNLKKILEEKEREVITEVLKITKGNKTKAGEILGIPRQTLKYKIDKLNLEL